MAIRGNLSEASLADVLQLLALGQKTGSLSVGRDGSFGSVHFDHGRIVHAAIVNRRDQLGERLVRSGAIAADELARVVAASAPQDDRALAAALLERGMEREVLVGPYRALVEDAVYHLFGWDSGTFTFEADAHRSDDEPLVSISADSLLLEGARRVDEWTLIEKRIPSLDLIFEVDTKRLQQSDVSLSATQERLLPLLDGSHDVLTMVERSGLDEFDVAKAVFGLITAGFAQRVGRSAARKQPPPESRIAEHRNLGIAFYRTGLYDEAEREFRRVLELRDEDGAARFHLGLVQLRRMEWDDAVATLGQVGRQTDAPSAVFHNLAFGYERLGRLEDAREALAEAARRTGERDPRTLLSEAVVSLLSGNVGGAEEQLQAARTAWGARQPTAAWYHAAGLTAALAGDSERAIRVLEEGLSVHPHASALHNNLAVIHERRGSYELASRTLEHALLEDANSPHLHKNLGDYLYRAQRYDDAFETLSRVIRLDVHHGSDVYLKLGNIHYRRGSLDEARRAWELALALDPDNRIVRANLDALRQRQGTTEPHVRATTDTVSPPHDDAVVEESALTAA
jgi:tetratricopeptide (TPR) repeat protein